MNSEERAYIEKCRDDCIISTEERQECERLFRLEVERLNLPLEIEDEENCLW